MRGLATDFFRQYKDISINKFCSRGVFGGSYNETNKNILKSRFGSPSKSENYFIYSGMSGQQKHELVENIEESIHNCPSSASIFSKSSVSSDGVGKSSWSITSNHNNMYMKVMLRTLK